jgi:hypothetical protein
MITSPSAASSMANDEAFENEPERGAKTVRDIVSSSLPCLSARGQGHGKKVTPFWDVFDKIIGNAFCEITNPHGIINMAISNNYLLEPELLYFFGANLHLQKADLTYGTSLFGSHRLFATLCKLFNSTHFTPVHPVEPHHLF